MPHRAHPRPHGRLFGPTAKTNDRIRRGRGRRASHPLPGVEESPAAQPRRPRPLRDARPAVTPSAEGRRPGAVTAAPRRPADPRPRGNRRCPPNPGRPPTQRGERAPPPRGEEKRAARPRRGTPHLPLPLTLRRSPPSAQDGGCRPPPSLSAPPITAEPPPRMPRPRPAGSAHASRVEAGFGGWGAGRAEPRGACWEL